MSAFLLGLTDIDALTFSMARLGDVPTATGLAATAISVGMIANTCFRGRWCCCSVRTSSVVLPAVALPRSAPHVDSACGLRGDPNRRNCWCDITSLNSRRRQSVLLEARLANAD